MLTLHRPRNLPYTSPRSAVPLPRTQWEKLPYLTGTEEAALCKRWRECGDIEARNELVLRNMKLIPWIARRYLSSGLDFEDLMQEGAFGLMTAAEKYDYRIGRFTTYATWWVRQSLGRAVMDHSHMIRVPVHLQIDFNLIQKASFELARTLGRVPTAEELAQLTGYKAGKIVRTQKLMEVKVLSLDAKVRQNNGRGDGEQGVAFGDLLADIGALSPDMFTEAREMLERSMRRLEEMRLAVWRCFNRSPQAARHAERNQAIFTAFYAEGRVRNRPTLVELGERFGLTRERIRQIIVRTWQWAGRGDSRYTGGNYALEMRRVEALKALLATIEERDTRAA